MNNKGYTLIEMTVVVLLIGVMIGVAVPKVRDTITSDRLKKTARQLIGMSRELRSDAAREQVDYELYLDIDKRRFWKISVDMTSEKREEVKKTAANLPSGVRIRDVQIYGREKKTHGEAVIRFYRKGYMQPSVVHLEYEKRKMTLVFNPFVPAVKMYDDYLDVWTQTGKAG